MPKIIPALSEELDKENIRYEIIVMDDNSPDKTSQAVQDLAQQGYHCRCVVRKTNRGLSPAVIDGFAACKPGSIRLVMDADLSHPVEVVPKLYRAIADGKAEVAVGSRHCLGGGIENWPLKRKIISWGAALMAKPLATCSDPMSGFFAFTPSVIEGVQLNAKGFKILLEVLVKGHYNKVVEVPIVFKDREWGESKLGRGVIVSYILHLIALYLTPGTAPLLKFLFVGGCGMILDVTLFTILTMLLGFGGITGQLTSFCVALMWNFIMNRIWTFGKTGQSNVLVEFAKFVAVACVALLVRTGLFEGGKKYLGIHNAPWVQLLLVGVIISVTAINFIGSRWLVFNSNKTTSASKPKAPALAQSKKKKKH